MKKLLALSAVLACGLSLTACGNNDNSSSNNSSNGSSVNNTPTTKSVNVGVGYTGSFADGQFDLTTAMVAFDSTGRIEGARIDVIQVVVTAAETEGVAIASTKGEVGYNEDGTIKTKLELGKDYNMSLGGVNPVAAEVDAQIEDFAKWTVGKTVSEIKTNLVSKDDGHGGQSDYMKDGVLSSCTIVVGDFVAAIESAYALKSTKTYEVAPEFTTGVAVNANLYQPTVLDFDLGGALVVGDKVVAARVDCVAVEFTVAEGVVSLKDGSQYYDATTGAFKSKRTLGDDYGMKTGNGKGYGSADLEWWEQADVIEAACVGKTSAEIAALVKGTGDLASATMNLSTYVGSVAKAATYAPKAHVGPQA